MEGTSSETRNLHAWADKRHLYTKQRRRKEGNPLHPSVEAALKQLVQQTPDIKSMTFADAFRTVNEKLSNSNEKLMQYFAPDEAQISNFLNIPIPEPVAAIEEPKEEENFVGMRKIKLASPASVEPSEEEEPEVVVFAKDENDKLLKLKPKSKQLKRPSPTTIEELLQITNNDSIVAQDED